MLNTKEVPPVKKLCSKAIKVTHVFRKRRTQNNAIVWGSPNGAHFFKTMILKNVFDIKYNSSFSNIVITFKKS